MAIAGLRNGGAAEAFGVGGYPNSLEYGVLLRPDASALVVARRLTSGQGYVTFHAAEIDSAGRVSMIRDPENVNLSAFGVVYREDMLPRDPRPAG